MRPIELLLCAILSVSQPGTLEESVVALKDTRVNWLEARGWLAHFPARETVSAILDRLDTDPEFAPGTIGGNRAVRILAGLRGEESPLRIANRRQVEALAGALAWGDRSTQFEVMNHIHQVDPVLRPVMSGALARLIIDGKPSLKTAAIKASFEGEIHLPAETGAFIRELAIGDASQAEVWAAAAAPDEFLGGPEAVGRLRMVSVAWYLSRADELSQAWRETVDSRGKSGDAVLNGAAMACCALAENGAISKAGIEKQVTECMLALCNDPLARRTIEKGELLVLLSQCFCEPGDDQAPMARIGAALAAECDAVSKDQREYFVQALHHCGFAELAEGILKRRGAK